MPRLRRRAKARRSQFTDEQWAELRDDPDAPEGGSAFPSVIAKRAAWIEHRDAVMSAHLDDEHGYRWRPSPWWEFDAPRKPRRVVARRADGRPVFEADLAFLDRHGLATPEERAYLATLRERNAVLPDWPPDVREHPDALEVTTMRPLDWEAAESDAA